MSLHLISRAAAAAALVLGLGACTTWQAPEWREVPLGPVPFEDAWNAVVEFGAVDGYPLDRAESDRGLRVLQSRWKTRLHEFQSRLFAGSWRKRLKAEFERTDDGGGWVVRFHVEQQNVSDLAKNGDPAEEDWGPNGQDGLTEMRIQAKLNMRFHGAMPGAGDSSEQPGRGR